MRASWEPEDESVTCRKRLGKILDVATVERRDLTPIEVREANYLMRRLGDAIGLEGFGNVPGQLAGLCGIVNVADLREWCERPPPLPVSRDMPAPLSEWELQEREQYFAQFQRSNEYVNT